MSRKREKYKGTFCQSSFLEYFPALVLVVGEMIKTDQCNEK